MSSQSQPLQLDVNGRPIPQYYDAVADAYKAMSTPRPANVDTAALVTLTSATAGGNSADQTNANGRGLQLGINITAITGTSPTLTVTVQGKDPASGQYYTLLQSAALTAAAFTLLTIYPGAPSTANVSTPQVLPRTWRVLYAIGGTTPSVSATVSASVII